MPTAAQIVSCAPNRPRLRPVASSTSVSKQLCGPAIFKPRMKAAIELHQLAEVRLALAPPAMRAALPRAAPQPRRQHPPPQRFVIDRQPVFTRQMLGRQRRTEALVDAAAVLRADQRQHARRAAGVTSSDSTRDPRCDVSAPSRPAARYRPIQPLRLPVAHLHQRRRRSQRQRLRRDPRQYPRALQLSRTHRRPSQSTTSSEVVSLGGHF